MFLNTMTSTCYFSKPNYSKQCDFNYYLGDQIIQHSVGHVLQLIIENDRIRLESLQVVSTHKPLFFVFDNIVENIS
jgi:hypothetical protein